MSSVLRVYCPDVNSKAKAGEELIIYCCVDLETIKTVFRTITSVNQLSLYGAVAEMCEDCESLHERTERPGCDGTIKFLTRVQCDQNKVLLDSDDPAYWNFQLQQYGERIEKLSQQDTLSKFCMDVGFLSVVEIGQYFMTKDTADFFTISCSGLSWMQSSRRRTNITTNRNTKIGDPYWKLQPVTCTVNMELTSESSLWTKTKILTLGSEFLMARTSLSRIWTTSRKPQKCRTCVEIECEWFWKPIKGQSKTTDENLPVLPQRTIPIGWKNLDRCRTRRISNLRFWSMEEIDSSSSSWKTTHWRRWSNWILLNSR